MKYILLLLAAFLFTACNTTKPHCDECAKETAEAHAAHEGHGAHHHDGKAACCEGKGQACCEGKGKECCAKMDKGDRKCCSAGATCTDAKAGAVCKAEVATATVATMSQEELTKLYTKNKSKLGPTCSSAASAYCGKVTRDLNVTSEEFSCLVGKVNRATEESLPQLDGTDCAKMIKKIAKK